MKICGIVAEYDPFHKGHAHLIRAARERADAVVAVMSGWVTQRGEFACLPKYTRVEMALRGGADAVFELPAVFTVRPAEQFAAAGVDILRGIGCDAIAFGSESDADTLRAIARLSAQEDEETGRAIREKMAGGLSYIRARASVYAAKLGTGEDVITRPNTVLGAAYLARNAGQMEEIIVPRVTPYHGGIWSASRVRRLVWEGCLAEAADAMRQDAERFLKEMRERPADGLALACARLIPPEKACLLPDGGEGLGNRLVNCAHASRTREELVSSLVSARYTSSRASRLIMQAMLGITREMPPIACARLLGFRQEKKRVVGELQGRASLPVYTRARDIPRDIVFQTERRAGTLFSLAGAVASPDEEDLTHRMVIV